VPLRGTFKNFSGFYDSAKRCKQRLYFLNFDDPVKKLVGLGNIMLVTNKATKYSKMLPKPRT